MSAFYWLILAVFAFGAVLIYARAEARNKERLAALKAELLRRAREEERASAIKDNVSRLSDDNVRWRLRNIPRK